MNARRRSTGAAVITTATSSGFTAASSACRSSTCRSVPSPRPVTESARNVTSLNQTTRLPAEQRDRLNGLAETVHRRLDLAGIVGEPVQHLPRKLVCHLRRERVIALLAQPVDQEIIGPADEDERFGGHRAPVCRRSASSARKKRQPQRALSHTIVLARNPGPQNV